MWILVSLLLILAVAVAVLWPYLRPRRASYQVVVKDPQLTEFYNHRDMLYQAIGDAQFDKETGKLSDADFQYQSAELKQQAAVVLRSIDEYQTSLSSPELDAEVEAVVAEARQVPAPLKASVSIQNHNGSRYCSQCGNAMRKGDRFCGHCGQQTRN